MREEGQMREGPESEKGTKGKTRKREDVNEMSTGS